MKTFVFNKKVLASGQNLIDFLRSSDVNRRKKYTPKFYDLWSVSRFTDGKKKITFSKQEFVTQVASIISLTNPNTSQKSALVKAEIAFYWWKSREAIVQVS